MLDLNSILISHWRELDASATLQGTNYLTASGRIWKGTDYPESVGLPGMTVGGFRSIDESQIETWTIVVNSFTRELANGGADIPRLGLIGREVLRILDGASVTVSGGTVYNTYAVSDSGPKFDRAHPREHMQTILFRTHSIET